MGNNGFLTAEQILAAQDQRIEEVDVPEWGGSVLVRTMYAAERDLFEQDMMRLMNKSTKGIIANMRARFLVLVICDAAGKRLFTNNEMEQLGKKSGAAIDRLFEVASRINKMTTDDLEELAKNSETTQSEDLHSVSA